jgi:hypothetical protein
MVEPPMKPSKPKSRRDIAATPTNRVLEQEKQAHEVNLDEEEEEEEVRYYITAQKKGIN